MAQLAPSSPSVCVERGKEGSGTLIPKGRRKKKWSWLVLATVIVEASGDREKRFTICARPTIYRESIHSCTTTVRSCTNLLLSYFFTEFCQCCKMYIYGIRLEP